MIGAEGNAPSPTMKNQTMTEQLQQSAGKPQRRLRAARTNQKSSLFESMRDQIQTVKTSQSKKFNKFNERQNSMNINAKDLDFEDMISPMPKIGK